MKLLSRSKEYRCNSGHFRHMPVIVYPTFDTDGTLFINVPQNIYYHARAFIYNIQGMGVMEMYITSGILNSVDVNRFNSGMYLVFLEDQVKCLIVEKIQE